MNHVMLDLETLGVGNEPVLLSVGAVKFTADEIVDEFHMAVDPDSAPSLLITPSTVLWWMSPDLQDARAALLAQERHPLRVVLNRFTDWVGGPGPRSNMPWSEPLWGNGATADNVWLRSAYAAVELKWPFSHKADRCYRTMKNLVPDAPLPPSENIAHDALCDARWQAKHLQSMLKHSGLILA